MKLFSSAGKAPEYFDFDVSAAVSTFTIHPPRTLTLRTLMAKDIYCFCFKPSQAQNADCSIATNLRDFRGARTGSKERPATDVRIFFDEAMTRRFVNPLWLSDVNKAVKQSSYGGKVKGSTNALTCTSTWTFCGADDPELRRFDDFYQEILILREILERRVNKRV